MFELSTLVSYITACALIIISPGPAQVLVAAVTLSDGKKAGIITVLGLNSSLIIHVLAAAVGVSALLAASAEAFIIVKYTGAAYLIYIGLKSLLTISKKESRDPAACAGKEKSKLFSRAFLTGVLNPKVAVFFLAFVPQFIDPAKGYIILQFLLLGIILAAADIIYESSLTILIGKFRTLFINNSTLAKITRNISGLVMIALGIRMIFLKQD